MNDSPYGLTASIWTNAAHANSEAAFLRLVDGLETGTVYLNRWRLSYWVTTSQVKSNENTSQLRLP
jgi:acyl-CoA reductase-like NAD-dependent aldehyde dehydrogenase